MSSHETQFVLRSSGTPAIKKVKGSIDGQDLHLTVDDDGIAHNMRVYTVAICQIEVGWVLSDFKLCDVHHRPSTGLVTVSVHYEGTARDEHLLALHISTCCIYLLTIIASDRFQSIVVNNVSTTQNYMYHIFVQPVLAYKKSTYLGPYVMFPILGGEIPEYWEGTAVDSLFIQLSPYGFPVDARIILSG